MEQEAHTRVLDTPTADLESNSDATAVVRPPTVDVDRVEAPSPVARSGGGNPSISSRPRPVTSPPAQVGRYALVRRLAHGGMATVYLGRVHGAAGFEKVVALKLIHPHLANEPDFLEMFFDEARIAARIRHPHVVEILDLGEEQGMHYMAMEWVEGETLAALVRALRPGKLPVAVVLQVIADALEGLAAAHKLTDTHGKAMGLVHRDVSPQNLLISMDGFVKVTDFGIMKAAGRHGSTRTGELRGKVAYMSPEQARGKDLDARSDLFAVGVIAWELLHGRRLFAQSTDAATLERVMACEVPPVDDEALRGSDEAVAQGVRQWVARALSPEPQDRFESAREMLDAVRETLRMASERDPRTHLAAIMKAEFGERVAYVRASLRGLTPATQPVASLPPNNGRPPSASYPSYSTASAAQSVSASVTGVTGMGSPPRAWAALILLPLLGAAAAVGIAWALGLGRPDTAAKDTAAAVPPASAERIRWFVSTSPEGAELFIDGERHEETTPTQVMLPRGDTPVTLELRKAGMQPTRATVAPVGDDNLYYRLVPQVGSTPHSNDATSNPTAAADSADAATGSSGGARGPTAATTSSTPRKKVRVKKKFRPPSGQHSAGTPSESGDTGTKPSDSSGGLRPMPDFDEAEGQSP